MSRAGVCGKIGCRAIQGVSQGGGHGHEESVVRMKMPSLYHSMMCPWMLDPCELMGGGD